MLVVALARHNGFPTPNANGGLVSRLIELPA